MPGGCLTPAGSIGGVPGRRWAAWVVNWAAAGLPPVKACDPISTATTSAPAASPTKKKMDLSRWGVTP